MEQRIAELRDAKATKVIRWLEKANTTERVCRRCWLPITPDEHRWVTRGGGVDCGAPGFVAARVHAEHTPETWTPVLVANAPAELRERIGEAAGLTRPCSPQTWDRVVALFTPRFERARARAAGRMA
jgi:hypothetical protein